MYCMGSWIEETRLQCTAGTSLQCTAGNQKKFQTCLFYSLTFCWNLVDHSEIWNFIKLIISWQFWFVFSEVILKPLSTRLKWSLVSLKKNSSCLKCVIKGDPHYNSFFIAFKTFVYAIIMEIISFKILK